MYVDRTKIMRQHIDKLNGGIDAATISEDIESCIDEIMSLTEEIDLANDFIKMDGLGLISRMLKHEGHRFRAYAGEILAILTQNNEYAQKRVLEFGLGKYLFDTLDKETDPHAMKGLLHGTSCFVRGNKDCLKLFLEGDCFSSVLCMMERASNMLQGKSYLVNSENDAILRLLNKAAFFIYCLSQDITDDFIPTLQSSGCVEKMAKLAFVSTSYHGGAAEFLLPALLLLLSGRSQLQSAIAFARSDDLSSNNSEVSDPKLLIKRTPLIFSIPVPVSSIRSQCPKDAPTPQELIDWLNHLLVEIKRNSIEDQEANETIDSLIQILSKK
ncbi:unnamed protein product [Protopolystoma xenopodis]|uniref:Nucleotide exchange factor Fes1 domain-containing protein n=1 Tax=Protopolystoma xenopodis TaxID=117903 RepID=A0A448WKZ2_9PLAT|nr:unnamed protein product [Protopolystoma xenopodis]